MEYYCFRCGSLMIMTKAIGFYPFNNSAYIDYETESLYECLNCDTHYYFLDESPNPYFIGRLLYPSLNKKLLSLSLSVP